MKTLTIAEAAYIAGIMDGEGCISIYRNKKQANCNWCYGVACSVTNTNLTLMKWLQMITGLGIIRFRIRLKKSNHKPSYSWALRAKEITPLLIAILPYMLVKNEQADLILEFLAKSRHTYYGNPLTEDEISQKNVLFELMAEYNKRGL